MCLFYPYWWSLTFIYTERVRCLKITLTFLPKNLCNFRHCLVEIKWSKLFCLNIFLYIIIIIELILPDSFQWGYQKVPYSFELNLQIGNKRLVKLIYGVCIVLMFEIYFPPKVHKQYWQIYCTLQFWHAHNVGWEVGKVQINI